jgi:CheY-like chemotaxis protein
MGARIVVAHSDLDSLQRISAALRQARYEVAEFADPMNALLALERPDPVAALVTKINFGDGILNGVALARLARSRRPDIKLVFAASPEYQLHTVGLGELVPPPIVGAAIVDAVERVLAGADETPLPRDGRAFRESTTMTYRLFYTDVRVTEVQYRAAKPILIAIEYSEFDDALGMARDINASGRFAWEIEGDVGVIGAGEIARQVRERAAELKGHPKVY